MSLRIRPRIGGEKDPCKLEECEKGWKVNGKGRERGRSGYERGGRREN